MQVVRQETQPIIINLQVGERGKVEKEEAEMILLVGPVRALSSKHTAESSYLNFMVNRLFDSLVLSIDSPPKLNPRILCSE